LLVSKERKKFSVRSDAEFVELYPTIFTSALGRLLAKQEPACVGRIGDKGLTISRGEIWFNVDPQGTVKIFTITPVVMPDE
jgi:hypothetical protein